MASQLPQTYKAVVINKANDRLALTEVPLQRPGPGQVLVKVRACGLCYADLMIADGRMGDVFPRVPGHEIVGDVVELGPAVAGFQLGDRVGGPWHGGHDARCRSCRRGQFQMCDNQAINGLSQDGGFAEYVLLRAEAVVRVPPEADPAQMAPLLCAGVTVFNGIRKMAVQQGALVAVQGLGGLGHLAVQFAHKMGYQVAVLSSGDDKASFARQLGASHYFETRTLDGPAELAKLGGASIIVQTAPNPNGVGALVHGLAVGGKLLCLAPVGAVQFDTHSLIKKGTSIQGWPSGHALDSEEAIRFAIDHQVKCMVETYRLADIQAAVDSLKAGKPRFRNVLLTD